MECTSAEEVSAFKRNAARKHVRSEAVIKMLNIMCQDRIEELEEARTKARIEADRVARDELNTVRKKLVKLGTARTPEEALVLKLLSGSVAMNTLKMEEAKVLFSAARLANLKGKESREAWLASQRLIPQVGAVPHAIRSTGNQYRKESEARAQLAKWTAVRDKMSEELRSRNVDPDSVAPRTGDWRPNTNLIDQYAHVLAKVRDAGRLVGTGAPQDAKTLTRSRKAGRDAKEEAMKWHEGETAGPAIEREIGSSRKGQIRSLLDELKDRASKMAQLPSHKRDRMDSFLKENPLVVGMYGSEIEVPLFLLDRPSTARMLFENAEARAAIAQRHTELLIKARMDPELKSDWFVAAGLLCEGSTDVGLAGSHGEITESDDVSFDWWSTESLAYRHAEIEREIERIRASLRYYEEMARTSRRREVFLRAIVRAQTKLLQYSLEKWQIESCDDFDHSHASSCDASGSHGEITENDDVVNLAEWARLRRQSGSDVETRHVAMKKVSRHTLEKFLESGEVIEDPLRKPIYAFASPRAECETLTQHGLADDVDLHYLAGEYVRDLGRAHYIQRIVRPGNVKIADRAAHMQRVIRRAGLWDDEIAHRLETASLALQARHDECRALEKAHDGKRECEKIARDAAEDELAALRNELALSLIHI